MLNDARIYQLLFLSLFLALGLTTRDWALHPGVVGVAIATCISVQAIAVTITYTITQFRRLEAGQDADQELAAIVPGKPEPADMVLNTIAGNLTPQAAKFSAQDLKLRLQNTLPSALITALGLSLLLRVDHYSTMMFAAAAAISSKFLLRFRDKHIFNPGNFGIVAALTLTQDAWVSPGQWGEEGWYALLFLSLGGIVLQRVGRWDTSIAFLAGYAGLEAARNAWLGWTWDVWLHRLMSGSLLVFALFMVTDPRTIPNARTGRLLWAVTIAILAFVLRNHFFISTAVFWSLFILSPLSILLDMFFPAASFSWRSQSFSNSQNHPAMNSYVH